MDQSILKFASQMEKALLKLNRTGDTMPLMGFGTWKVPK